MNGAQMNLSFLSSEELAAERRRILCCIKLEERTMSDLARIGEKGAVQECRRALSELGRQWTEAASRARHQVRS